MALKLKSKYVLESPDPGNDAIVNFIEDRKINPRKTTRYKVQERLDEEDEKREKERLAQIRREKAAAAQRERAREAREEEARQQAREAKKFNRKTDYEEPARQSPLTAREMSVENRLEAIERKTPQKNILDRSIAKYKYNVGDSKNILKKAWEGAKAVSKVSEGAMKATLGAVPKGFASYVRNFNDWFYSGIQDIPNMPSNVGKAWDKYRIALGSADTLGEKAGAIGQFWKDTTAIGSAERLVNKATPHDDQSNLIGRMRSGSAGILDPALQKLEGFQRIEDQPSLVQDIAGGIESLPYSVAPYLGGVGFVMNYGVTSHSAAVQKYYEALDSGVEITDDVAFKINAYSAGSGIVEAATEQMLPFGKAKFAPLIKKLGPTKIAAIATKISKLPGATMVLGGAEESFEEVLSAFGTGFLAKILTDPDAPLFGAKEDGALINATDIKSATVGAFFIAAITQGLVDTVNMRRTKAVAKMLEGKPADQVTPADVEAIVEAAKEDAKDPASVEEIGKKVVEETVNTINRMPESEKAQNIQQEIEVQEAFLEGEDDPAEITKYQNRIKDLQAELEKISVAEVEGEKTAKPAKESVTVGKLRKQLEKTRADLDKAEKAPEIPGVSPAMRESIISTIRNHEQDLIKQIQIAEAADVQVQEAKKAEKAAQKKAAQPVAEQVTLEETESLADRVIADARASVASEQPTEATMPVQAPSMPVERVAEQIPITDVSEVAEPSTALAQPLPAVAEEPSVVQEEITDTPEPEVVKTTVAQSPKKVNQAIDQPVPEIVLTQEAAEEPLDEDEAEFAVPEMPEPEKRTRYAVPEGAETGNLVWTDNGNGTKVLTLLVRMPFDKLIGSMDAYGEKNPNFPEAFQPRDTDRKESKKTIADIAQKPGFDRMAGTNVLQEGTIVAQMNEVNGEQKAVAVAGNHRYSGFARMRKDFPDNFRRMKSYWNARYKQDGFASKSQNSDLVVVRLLPTDVDGPAIASITNKGGISVYSPSENARADAQKIDNDMLRLFVPNGSGSYATEANKDFVRAFVSQVVPVNERNTVQDEKGNLSAAGESRIRNAIFYKAYENMGLVAALSEKIDTEGLKNLVQALDRAAPKFVELNPMIKDGSVYDIPLLETIGEAATQVAQLIRDPQSALSTTRQTAIGEDDVYVQAQKVSKWIKDNNSSYVRIQNFLESMADNLRSKGDPRDAGMAMLDPSLVIEPPTLASIVDEAIAKAEAIKAEEAKLKAAKSEPKVAKAETEKKINKKPRVEARKSIAVGEAENLYDYEGTASDYAEMIANMKNKYGSLQGDIRLAEESEITDDAKEAANLFFKITKLPVVFFNANPAVRGMTFSKNDSRVRLIAINVNRTRVGRHVVADLLSSMGHEWFHVAQLNGFANEMAIAMAKTMRLGQITDLKLMEYAEKNFKVSRATTEAWQRGGILMDEVFARRAGQLFKSEYFWAQLDYLLGSDAGKAFRRIVDSVKEVLERVKGVYADPNYHRMGIKQFENEVSEILKTIENVSKTVDPDTYKTAFLMRGSDFNKMVAKEAAMKNANTAKGKDSAMRNEDGSYNTVKVRETIEKAQETIEDLNSSDEDVDKAKDIYKRYSNIMNIQMKNPDAFKHSTTKADFEYLEKTKFNKKNYRSGMTTVGPQWRAERLFTHAAIRDVTARTLGKPAAVDEGMSKVKLNPKQAAPRGIEMVRNIMRDATGVPFNYYLGKEDPRSRTAPLGLAQPDPLTRSTYAFVDPFWFNQRSVIGTMGHEFFHIARMHGYGYYFEKATMDALGVKTHDDLVALRKQTRPTESPEYLQYLIDNDALVEEVLADNAGRVFRSKLFWEGLKDRVSPEMPWHRELAALAGFMNATYDAESANIKDAGVTEASIRAMIATMESTLSDTDFSKYTNTYNIYAVANDFESLNREERYPFLITPNQDKIRNRELSRIGENEIFLYDYEGVQDPVVEANIRAASDFDKSNKSFASWLKKAWAYVRDNTMRGAVPELSTTKYGNLRNYFRNMYNAHNNAGSAAFAEIKKAYGRLTKKEKILFDRHILLADYARDLRNGVTGHTAGAGAVLKYAFTDQSQVELELARTEQHLQDPRYAKVVTAIRAREQMFEETRNRYINTAAKLGVDITGMFSHGSNYMHQIIKEIEDDFRNRGERMPGSGSIGVKVREGSEMAHITDVFISDLIILEKLNMDVARMELAVAVKGEDISRTLPINPVTGQQGVPKGYARATLDQFGFYFPETTIRGYAVKAAKTFIQTNNIVDPALIRQIMAQARSTKLETNMVVPVDAIKAADRIFKGKAQLDNPGKFALRLYKGGLLIAPWRIVPYQVKNAASDIYAVMITYPGVYTRPGLMARAFTDLEQYYFGHGAAKQLMDYMRDGGLSAGGTKVNREEWQKDQLLRFKDKLLQARTPSGTIDALRSIGKGVWTNYENGINMREQLLRYATYLYLMEVEMNNAQGLPRFFGGSNAKEIMNIKSKSARATRLATDALGAFDDTSTLTQWLSKTGAVPFARWTEVNLKRTYRVLINSFYSPSVALGVGWSHMQQAGAIARGTVNTAWQVGKLVGVVTALQIAVDLFNKMAWPEEEEALPDEIKNQPHIILGNFNGRVQYFIGLNPLFDAIDQLGLGNITNDVKDVLSGKYTKEQKIREMVERSQQENAASFMPAVKLLLALQTGTKQTQYGSAPVRNTWEYVFTALGAGDEYKRLFGKELPKKQGVAPYLEESLVSSIDLGQQQYYDAFGLFYDWQERMRLPRNGPTTRLDDPAYNAAYYFKQSLMLDDQVAARKYLADYLVAIGGNKGDMMKKLHGKLEAMHPLAAADRAGKEQKKQFLDSLNDVDKKMLEEGIEYYNRILAEGMEYAEEYAESVND